jgi:hypothetical protein
MNREENTFLFKWDAEFYDKEKEEWIENRAISGQERITQIDAIREVINSDIQMKDNHAF